MADKESDVGASVESRIEKIAIKLNRDFEDVLIDASDLKVSATSTFERRVRICQSLSRQDCRRDLLLDRTKLSYGLNFRKIQYLRTNLLAS